jgi:DNA-binding response OmpR family regulator
MTDNDLLKNRKILAVDDETDVLDLLKEQFEPFEITTANSYEEAERFLESQTFDLALLDIMGVNGFALLQKCREKQVPAAMLTAHSITVESVNRALELGAISFLPKQELANISDLVAEIFEGLDEGKSHWRKLFDRLGPFFREHLGLTWEKIGKPRNPPYMY